VTPGKRQVKMIVRHKAKKLKKRTLRLRGLGKLVSHHERNISKGGGGGKGIKFTGESGRKKVIS